LLVAARLLEPSTFGEESQPKPPGQEAPLSEINWALELRKIEREYDGLPPEPTAAEQRQKRETEKRERERQDAAAASYGV
jgi:hypothetical protein